MLLLTSKTAPPIANSWLRALVIDKIMKFQIFESAGQKRKMAD